MTATSSSNPRVTVSPDVMWGAPVFAGTRVPGEALFDYLKGGDTLETFLDDFPTVGCEHAVAVLELAGRAVMERAINAAARSGDKGMESHE